MRNNHARSQRISPRLRAYIRSHPSESLSSIETTFSLSDSDTDTLSLGDSSSSFSSSYRHRGSGSGRLGMDSSRRKKGLSWLILGLFDPFRSRTSYRREKKSRPAEPSEERGRARNHTPEPPSDSRRHRRSQAPRRHSRRSVPVESTTSTSNHSSEQEPRVRRSKSTRSREPTLSRPVSRRMDSLPPLRREPSPRMTGAGPSATSQPREVRFEEPDSPRPRSPQASRPPRTQSPVSERAPLPRGRRFTPGREAERQGPSTQTNRSTDRRYNLGQPDGPSQPRNRSRKPAVIQRSPQRQSGVNMEERHPQSSSQQSRPDIIRRGREEMAGSARNFLHVSPKRRYRRRRGEERYIDEDGPTDRWR